MNFKPVVLALLTTAGVTAAAGGAFIAVRQNRADVASSTRPGTAGGPVAAPGTAPAQPVTETEAVVTQATGVVSTPEVAGKRPAEAPGPASAPPARAQRQEAGRPAPSTSRPGPASAAPLGHPSEPVGPSSARTQEGGPATPSATQPQSARDASPSAPQQGWDASTPDVTRAPDPPPVHPEAKLVEVIVPASAVIGLQVDRTLSSENARVEDRVDARVTRDVMAGGRRAIAAGSRVIGSVVLVERGGKVKEQARLGVRFHTLVLANGLEVPLRTEAIYRDGDSPGAESSRKIGGAAVGGAILGAILGGGKGAMLGGATGAAGGTAAVMAGGRNAAVLPSGAIVTARVAEPITIQVERD